jgi:sugar/nucleoside kinase (ribokinase family)
MRSSGNIIVGGHICLDIIPRLDQPLEIRPGGLLRIGGAEISTGGAVANTGLALHRLGVPVQLMGKVGDDPFGRIVFDVLASHSADLTRDMRVATGEQTSYSIVLSPPATDRSFLHCPGCNDTFGHDDLNYRAIADSRIFHFGYPTIMRSLYTDGGLALHRMFERVRLAGTAVSVDTAMPSESPGTATVNWMEILRRMLPTVDVFQPSLEELLVMLGHHQSPLLPSSELNVSALLSLAQEVIDLGCPIVVIKLGENGLLLRCGAGPQLDAACGRLGLVPSAWENVALLSPIFYVDKVAGTTGSGDCTVAGFLAAVLRGESPSEAARSACAVGACSVEAVDATSGVPAWTKVLSRLQRGWQRRAKNPTSQWHQDVFGNFDLTKARQ